MGIVLFSQHPVLKRTDAFILFYESLQVAVEGFDSGRLSHGGITVHQLVADPGRRHREHRRRAGQPGDLVCGDNTGVIVVPFEHVEEVLTLGDKVTVVCLGKDRMGRLSFSMKDVNKQKKNNN